MFIKPGDEVKNSKHGRGYIYEVDVDEDELYVEFGDDVRLFSISDFSKFFKKYFKEENVFKEYNTLTETWLNENGYDDDGFDKDGYDQTGFDRKRVHYVESNSLIIYEMIIDYIKGDINENSFRDALIKIGKETTDPVLKTELRYLYKELRDTSDLWKESIKEIIVKIKGWNSFSAWERSDRPPPQIKNKKRDKHCFECKGSLYFDLHNRCSKCNWLVCPYDEACGCHYVDESRNIFLSIRR